MYYVSSVSNEYWAFLNSNSNVLITLTLAISNLMVQVCKEQRLIDWQIDFNAHPRIGKYQDWNEGSKVLKCIVFLKVLFAKYVYLPLKDKLRSSISRQGILNVVRNTQKHIFCVMIKNHSLDKTQFIPGIAFTDIAQIRFTIWWCHATM